MRLTDHNLDPGSKLADLLDIFVRHGVPLLDYGLYSNDSVVRRYTGLLFN